MRTNLLASVALSFTVAAVACGGATPVESNVPDAAVDSNVPDAGKDVAPAPDTGTPDTGVPTPDAGPPCGVALDATVQATLRLTADNERKVYVNGALVDDVAYAWSDPRSYEVTLFRHPKKQNVIAIEGINTSSQGGYDRGILAVLTSAADAGVAFSLVTDASWKMNPALVTDWFAPTTSDAAWPAAFDQAPNGTSPWGTIVDIPLTAKWIWTYDSSTASTKLDGEHVYARRTFYVAVDGSLADAAATCSD